MLLTISTTHQPARELGFLLHKHPDRAQRFEISRGEVHVFYPEADDRRCTAALVLDLDPVELVRGKEHTSHREFTLDQYVNDRPYVASSYLCTAISQVYGTALTGNCSAKPKLAATPLPLEVSVSTLRCRGDGSFIGELFEPLGYQVEIVPIELDRDFPSWGTSNYFEVTLRGEVRLAEMLSHLYVLLPVIDGEKHYWIDEQELEKLERHGGSWLAAHPRLETILRRYLKPAWAAVAQARELYGVDHRRGEDQKSDEPPLNRQRMEAVFDVLAKSGARSVLDLGCGEGRLLRELKKYPRFERMAGLDVDYHRLKRAASALDLRTWPDFPDQRIDLFHGSVLYRDERLKGFDAAVLVEVIEHMEPSKLRTMERVVFDEARPNLVVITTPNQEYNDQWESLPAGRMRHEDHRFEWTRAQFQRWAEAVATRQGYSVRFQGIGADVEGVGTPTQMGVFKR